LALKRGHEQSVIDGFFDRFREAATDRGLELFRCSLDGQDTLTGADYLFTQSTWFALVEFKYEESKIADERTKPLRLALCKALGADRHRLIQHVSCHFIGWSLRNPRTVMLNVYRHEVCHRTLWGSNSGLQLSTPRMETRIEADRFMEDFFRQDNSAGSSFEAFDDYLKWLLGTSGSNGATDATDIELLLYNPGDSRCVFHEFSSLIALKRWFDNNPPRSKPSPRSGPSP
jgi:hypothetical protein